ncbi:MAG: DUF4361 domain-containing protein [Bacteroidales bacterium]|jgi:hypothetical protein|nr:DUF4361 domain-containing protein [Bacteroidales bacterium]
MKNLIFLTILSAGVLSCNIDAVYEKEQYKKVIALVSNAEYNVFPVVHDLEEPETAGYAAAVCGGTNPTDREIRISLAPDREIFDNYNMRTFDVDSAKFARLMPESQYTIGDYGITIPAGERYGRMEILVRPGGLSPDSTYFIPLKAESISAYELNPDKDYLLYRVLIKNRWATQESVTNYTMRAFRGTTQLPGVKVMHPISRNRVRVMVANAAFQSNIATINQYGMYLDIGANNRVSITPVKDLVVSQVDGDPDYPNLYRLEDDGYRKYQTFLLRYNYMDGSTTYQMKEELRLEIKEE